MKHLTEEECLEAAKKYTVYKEFANNSYKEYRRACLKIEQLTAYNYIWSYK